MYGQTVADGLERYQLTVSIHKRGYDQEKHRISVIRKSPLGKVNLSLATSVDIASYRDWRLECQNPRTGKKISGATVRLEMSLLSNFFDICRIEWGLVDKNPVANVRKPKSPPGRDRRISAREERQILRYSYGHSNTELYSIIVIALETAMRQGEILSLRWENINLKNSVAHLPETKNGTKRDVPLSVRAREGLIRLGVKARGSVFSYTSNGIKSTWRYMVMKLGIEDLHFHDCRHEATSRLFELGTLDIMEISCITGHKSLSMLKRYTHLRAQRLVHKLEGKKGRNKRFLIDQLIPYPAQIIRGKSNTTIRLLDFEGSEPIIASTEEMAVMGAQDRLMRLIFTCIKDGISPPSPDQYLESVDELSIVMIDPLPNSEIPITIEH